MTASENSLDPGGESREPRRRQLGRGLSALFGDEGEGDGAEGASRFARLVPIGQLQPGRFQPRAEMGSESLTELAESIRAKGVLQPLLVRRHPTTPGAYEIIAGERRWRAAQRAELHELPVIVRELSDKEALEIALVENLQRQDLSPLEEATGYQRLMDEFAHTQEALARAVGKSRSHVANSLRLLGLPEPVKGLLAEGRLSAGHARALLAAENPLLIAREVVRRGLNVRQTERLVSAGWSGARRRGRTVKDTDTRELEADLSRLLGLRVRISPRRQGGSVSIHYETLEQLDEVVQRLARRERSPRDAPETGAGAGEPAGRIDPGEDFAFLLEPGPEAPGGGMGEDIAPIQIENGETPPAEPEAARPPAPAPGHEDFLSRVESLLAGEEAISGEEDIDQAVARLKGLAEEAEAPRRPAGAPAAPAAEKPAEGAGGDAAENLGSILGPEDESPAKGG